MTLLGCLDEMTEHQTVIVNIYSISSIGVISLLLLVDDDFLVHLIVHVHPLG